jgi:hypothetical protein
VPPETAPESSFPSILRQSISVAGGAAAAQPAWLAAVDALQDPACASGKDLRGDKVLLFTSN